MLFWQKHCEVEAHNMISPLHKTSYPLIGVGQSPLTFYCDGCQMQEWC